jgi:hypothetical protein
MRANTNVSMVSLFIGTSMSTSSFQESTLARKKVNKSYRKRTRESSREFKREREFKRVQEREREIMGSRDHKSAKGSRK